MLLFLFVILLVAAAFALFFVIELLCDDEYAIALIAAAIMALCIVVCVSIVQADDYQALKHKDVTIGYDVVREVSDLSIELDDSTYIIQDNLVTKKYPLDFTQIKEGDVVKYVYLSGNFHDYLISVEKVK